MKQFCILTTGRSGSTSLINALGEHDDIVTLSKVVESEDNELFHPKEISRYLAFFSNELGISIKNEIELIDAFFRLSEKFGGKFVGFKSMPNRHKQLQSLVSNSNIQIITLVRNDVASTIASFLMAMQKGTWRRNGENHSDTFTFSESMKQTALSNLQYTLKSERYLRSVKGAIHLEFEALCRTDFENSTLNQYFERPIKLSSPKSPTTAESYVTNWREFSAFIEQHEARIRSSLN